MTVWNRSVTRWVACVLMLLMMVSLLPLSRGIAQQPPVPPDEYGKCWGPDGNRIPAPPNDTGNCDDSSGVLCVPFQCRAANLNPGGQPPCGADCNNWFPIRSAILGFCSLLHGSQGRCPGCAQQATNNENQQVPTWIVCAFGPSFQNAACTERSRCRTNCWIYHAKRTNNNQNCFNDRMDP